VAPSEPIRSATPARVAVTVYLTASLGVIVGYPFMPPLAQKAAFLLNAWGALVPVAVALSNAARGATATQDERDVAVTPEEFIGRADHRMYEAKATKPVTGDLAVSGG
jgi:hypothetical protein